MKGLILVNAATLLDGDPLNNYLKRAVTFNPGGALNDANNITIAGTTRTSRPRGLVDREYQRSVEAARRERIVSSIRAVVRFSFAMRLWLMKRVESHRCDDPEQRELSMALWFRWRDAHDVYVAHVCVCREWQRGNRDHRRERRSIRDSIRCTTLKAS